VRERPNTRLPQQTDQRMAPVLADAGTSSIWVAERYWGYFS
jgi:hypothetical protein